MTSCSTKISGDALLDPYLDDDGPLPAGDTTQVAITPARPPGETAADAIELQLGELQDDAGVWRCRCRRRSCNA